MLYPHKVRLSAGSTQPGKERANKALELTAYAWWNVGNFHACRAHIARASVIGGSSAGTFGCALHVLA